MPLLVRRLAPILIAEFILTLLSSIFSGALTDSFASDLHLIISLTLFPFIAGYIAARANDTFRLRHGALAGISLSLASFAAVILAFAIALPFDQYLLAILGYILSTIFIALLPQALFGFFGGWVERKCHPIPGL
jgi:hypothetical protein